MASNTKAWLSRNLLKWETMIRERFGVLQCHWSARKVLVNDKRFNSIVSSVSTVALVALLIHWATKCNNLQSQMVPLEMLMRLCERCFVEAIFFVDSRPRPRNRPRQQGR